MIYKFKCPEHGIFEVNQRIMTEHKAYCPICGILGSRVYQSLPFQFGKADYNKDGSRDLNPDLPDVPSKGKYTHGWTPKEKGE